MLSTKILSNANAAQHYFLGEDNYYTQEYTMAKDQSQWWGQGSAALGLQGKVESELFMNLLQGKLLNGQQLGVVVDGELKHRPGFDLTFSAPKSVSILALMGGDERIFKAVERATDKALSLIEQEQAKARVTRNGITEPIKTENLIVAKFLHELSREGDPQLHTHCVVMNITQRPDGRWRALASQLGNYKENAQKIPEGFIEGVRHYKKYYGAVFRAELAYEMEKLGYTVEKTNAQGFFEIGGISKESIEAYSERRADIQTYLKEHGFSGAKAAAVATLQTRQSKSHIDHENLQAIWQDKSRKLAVDAFLEAKQIVNSALLPEKSHSIEHTNSLVAQQVVLDAILHLSENAVTLRENAILHHAMQNAVGKNISVYPILKAVDNEKRSGVLIPLPNENPRAEMQFTTQTLLKYEQELLDTLAKPHITQHPILPKTQRDAVIAKYPELSTSQTKALEKLFSCEKRIMAVTGSAGSGKSHLIAPIMELAETAGYRPVLLSLQKSEVIHLEDIHKHPKNLREWIKQQFDQKQFATVQGFLYQAQNDPIGINLLQKKPLLIVDKAHQLSSRQLHGLVSYVDRNKGRLIVMGDPKATLSWQAGSPFTQILAHDVATAELNGNHKNIGKTLRSAVSHSLQGNIQAAFKHIGNRVVEVEDKSSRLSLMAAHYVGIESAERQNTYLSMPTKAACHEMNLAIRDRLKEVGELKQKETVITTLQSHYQSAAESKYAKNYLAGQWVRFHGEYRSLGVRRGDYREIAGIDLKNNKVLLKQGAKIYRWDPARIAQGKAELFDPKGRPVSIGEKITWRVANKKVGLQAGERLSVTNVQNNKLSLVKENNKAITLDLRKLESRHFDYGYSTTIMQKPVKTPDCLIAYQNSSSRQSHLRSFYQLISQAKKHAWIYTENKAQLMQTLEKHSGNKTTAIEALIQGKSQDDKALTHAQIIENSVEKSLQQLEISSTAQGKAKAAVQYAISHLSEREAAFKHAEVMQVALQYALGKTNTQDIQAAVQQAEKNGGLIAGLYSTNGQYWTTKEALQLEKEIIVLARQDQHALTPLASIERIHAHLSKVSLSKEHTEVLQNLLTHNNRITLLQGFAGTGKTTLLQQVQAVLKEENTALLCLAPTHQAVKELKNRGLKGCTLDQFLKDANSNKLVINEKHVIALDESSMVSNRKLHAFLTVIKNQQARSIIMGDTRQYSAIESGKPFALLQQASIPTLHLTEITRQKEPLLQQAVKETYDSNFPKAFQTLENHIKEIGSKTVHGEKIDNRSERLAAIRDDYLSRSKEHRNQTLILTFGNEDRVQLNNMIREGLKQEDELKGQAITLPVLTPCAMTEVERSMASNYQSGDIIRFNGNDAALGVEKGQYWQIQSIHKEQNLLILERENAIKLWKPSYASGNKISFEVFKQENREIQEGDLIRWTRTDKNLGLINPEIAVVQKIQNHILTLQTLHQDSNGLITNGEPFSLQPNNPAFQHWDHAYAVTGYSAQGKTAPSVIIHAESFRSQLATQPAFLVAVTRAVNDLAIYTDSKSALLNSVAGNEGQKLSALNIMKMAGKEQCSLRQSHSTIDSHSKKPTLIKGHEVDL